MTRASCMSMRQATVSNRMPQRFSMCRVLGSPARPLHPTSNWMAFIHSAVIGPRMRCLSVVPCVSPQGDAVLRFLWVSRGLSDTDSVQGIECYCRRRRSLSCARASFIFKADLCFTVPGSLQRDEREQETLSHTSPFLSLTRSSAPFTNHQHLHTRAQTLTLTCLERDQARWQRPPGTAPHLTCSLQRREPTRQGRLQPFQGAANA